jgi:hypothetical protein
MNDEPPKEIFRIFPEYQKLSITKKIDILLVLMEWASKEIKRLKKEA